ncbi:DNA-directed RNA polymerases I and III subunit RPAC2-like [Liolophura sinensis]|uniref:DNA-directed RNA polymerases I and III subunit RPAC2-like n=1 Tax=Liolophura sinensis TaxID=3198878 RepID=UPI0031584E8E
MEGTEEKKRKLEVAQTTESSDDERCRTFVLHKEDHTLGNALRFMLIKNPDVDFCGYSVPHPSEEKINLRIQTKEKPATEVLKEALTSLNQLCEHVLTTLDTQVDWYKQRAVHMETD